MIAPVSWRSVLVSGVAVVVTAMGWVVGGLKGARLVAPVGKNFEYFVAAPAG
jgi:hypothetical protein